MAVTLHVVSHTHWDREWYHSAGRFRQRLVALVDELLDAPPAEGASFLLDGQAVVLDDYLAIRPERQSELAAALRRGALEAGPWFVLADELTPGAEALVRNLLAGRRTLRALRAESPPVLYCPDSFGHPATLPELAAGFGFDMVILWRGYGGRRWPAGDTARWRAPSGASVLLYHLPTGGYETGASLPTDEAAVRARWEELRAAIVDRSRLGVALLPNGADHHARQRALSEALLALARIAAPNPVVASSLSAFALVALERAAQAELPEISGELRDSYGYTWTLQGTFGTRAQQKRRAATLERLLTREVEPWTALAARSSGRSARSARALVQAAWRELLLCHPHDTLCGCSIDEVARAADARLDAGMSQALGLRDDAIAQLAGFDAETARAQPDAWRPHLILLNPVPRRRGGVAVVELTRLVRHVRVGPGSGERTAAPDSAVSGSVEADTQGAKAPALSGIAAVQMLSSETVHERLESPRAYPYDDLVERISAAVWVPPLGGFGMRAIPLEAAGAGPAGSAEAVPNPVRVRGHEISNGLVSLRVDGDGSVTMQDHVHGRTIAGLFTLEDQDDLGDLYTPSLRGALRSAEFLGAEVRHSGILIAEIVARWRIAVRDSETVTTTVALSLHADSPVVRVHVAGENVASDHRLRFRVRTDVTSANTYADAAFGPVKRAPLSVSAEDARMETPLRSAPLHRYVTLANDDRGASLISDGLAEYESDSDGGVAVTLVRAVGELSRADLPERPGHAGWPVPTPEVQSFGPFSAGFGVLLHGAWGPTTVGEVERAAEDLLVPLRGRTLRWLLETPSEVAGPTLEGEGLVFAAMKESDDGEWLVLRCVNVTDRPVAGRWVFSVDVQEARLSRLDETPGAALSVAGSAVAVSAEARQVVTILVR